MIKFQPRTEDKAKWMPCPGVNTQYPGLAYVCNLDQLIVVERLDALHKVIGKKTDGVYTIFNKSGEKVFLAVRDNLDGKLVIKVFNFYGNEVIEVKKPRHLFLNRILVSSPPGNYVGSVEQDCFFNHNFIVKNREKQSVLKIKGQRLFKFVYDIMSNGEKIGSILRKCEINDVDDANICVTFPVDLVVEEKVVLLSACFLIGYLKCANKCC